MRIQGRLQLPALGQNGLGYWPAFWTLGGNFRDNVTWVPSFPPPPFLIPQPRPQRCWNSPTRLTRRNSNWPAVGELDIMENVNAENKIHGTMHCGINPGGPCDETNGISGSTKPTSSAAQGNFHTYTMEIDRSNAAAEAVHWYLDGVQYHQVAMSKMDTATWNQAIHNSYFILLNVAIGGTFPDKVAGKTTPIESTASSGTMLVDYVAVYNSA